MADFDFSTLVTDRSPADLETLRDLLDTPMADWTAEQLAEFNQATSKGAYNYTDLNRVIAAMDDINERLTAAGYVTGYQRIPVPHQGGGGGNSRLPSGYTELQYIESSGTQFIETGFTPNQDSRVICEFQLLDAYTSIRGVFGVRDSASGTASQQFILCNNGTSSFRTDYFGSQETLSSLSAQAQYTADKNRNVTTMGGQSATNPAASGQCVNDLVIFGVNNAGTVEYLSAMRLYACQVYDNGTLALDLVPCEDPDGDIGLYDLVSAQFLGNSGGGVFSAGPEAPPLIPDGYTELEYIQSDGGQYIDTKFKPNQDTRVVMDAYLQKRATGATYFISLSEYEPQSYYQVRITSSAQYLTSDFGNNSKNFAEIPLPGRYVIDKNKNLCTVGSESVSNTENGFQSQSNLLLLAGTTTAGDRSASPGIIYACQIYDDGALTRDFIPCKDTMGNVGLYDLVGAQFYGNAGTGDFAAGPEVPPPEPDPALDPYTWYEADAPTVSLLDGYLANVAALRAVLPLPETTPPVPVDMAELTQREANAIEDILDIIHTYLLALQSIFRRCGAAVCGGAGLYPIN